MQQHERVLDLYTFFFFYLNTLTDFEPKHKILKILEIFFKKKFGGLGEGCWPTRKGVRGDGKGKRIREPLGPGLFKGLDDLIFHKDCQTLKHS